MVTRVTLKRMFVAVLISIAVGISAYIIYVIAVVTGIIKPSSQYVRPEPPSFLALDSLRDADSTEQGMPPEDGEICNIFLKETPNFEIRTVNYKDDSSTYIFTSLEVRIKPSGVWKRIDHTMYGDSIVSGCGLGEITIFSDTEVGVFGFSEGYYFSNDSGQTWHFWKPSRFLTDKSLWFKDWNMSLDGRGEWIVAEVVLDKRERRYSKYVDAKLYTFSTTDKGLTWQLTKEEVPPQED